MSKIYIPDLTNYKCSVVRNDSTIRAYKEIPRNNSDIQYRDYYFTANYMYQDGIQSFGAYSTLPVCLDNSVLTNDYYYRNDFPSILLMFLIISIVGFYLPFKVLFRLFRRLN